MHICDLEDLEGAIGAEAERKLRRFLEAKMAAVVELKLWSNLTLKKEEEDEDEDEIQKRVVPFYNRSFLHTWIIH